MLLLRLRGRKTCDRLLRQGTVWKGKHLFIRWMKGYPRHPSSKPDQSALYVGTIASTKLDKSAVKRNRMRRRCREALRLLLKDLASDQWSVVSDKTTTTHYPLPTNHSLQLLIAPRSSSLRAPFAELESDLRAFLTFTKISYGRQEKPRQ